LLATATVVAATPLHAQPAAGGDPAAALHEYDRACAREGSRTWGRSLCGRLLLVDPATRRAVANAADSLGALAPAGDAFAGTLPTDVTLANTGVRWAGAEWAMVLLPLPADRFARLQLLAHESFHREQAA